MNNAETLNCVNDEVQSLLHIHLPVALEELENHILDLCKHFNLKIPGMKASDSEVRPCNFSISGQQMQIGLKADGVMFGSEIPDAKLILQVSRNVGKSPTIATYQSVVSHDNPLRLNQIQNAGNFLASALSLLRSRDRCPGMGISCIDEEVFDGKNPRMFISLCDASAFLSRLLQLLMRGMNSLCYPTKFPMITGDQSMSIYLNPPLPDDIRLSTFIEKNKLVIALFQSIPPPLGVSKPTSDSVNYIFKFKLDCHINHLEHIVNDYRKAVAACHSLYDKVCTLSQYVEMNEKRLVF